MQNFAYTARDSGGNAVSGKLMAESVAQVTQLLRGEGKYPTSIRPADESQTAEAARPSGVKVSRAEVIQLATQLAVMIETGVTISEALDCVAQQATRPQFKRMVEDLSRQVQTGSDFSSALTRHPRSFPRLFVSLIRASEKSGMMSRLLNRACTYLRDEQDIIRRVRGALVYPSIMLCFAAGTTLFLLSFVLPRFTAIYAKKGAALPLPTTILMNASDFIVGNWPYLLCGSAALAVGLTLYARTRRGARAIHWMQLRIPLIGGMLRQLHLARGLRMVGTMAGSGVNLVEAVQAAHDLSGNCYYRDLWARVSDQIQHGRQLSEPLFANPLVPRAVAQMIHSGEKGGKLAQVMEQVAAYSEQELKEKITEVTRYIEPAMILVMGLVVGGITLAMLLPIFTISRVIAA